MILSREEAKDGDDDDDIEVVYEARPPQPPSLPPPEDLVISDYPNPPTVILHCTSFRS